MRQAIRAMVSEPLIHFAIIGLVLFVLATLLRPAPEDPRLIKIDAGVQSHLAELFQQDRGRLPDRAEMDEMVQVFVRNEALYREARALRLDDGDVMMRERLAQRMRLMLYSGISVPQPTKAQMRTWFDENPDAFTIPAKLTLEIIGLDATEDEARALAKKAQAREGTDTPMRSPEVTLVSFKKRPRTQLDRLFGKAFVERITALEPETWAAVESPRGWQVGRMIEQIDEVPAEFENVIEEIRGEWREEQKQAEARAALEALMDTYPVEQLPYLPEVLKETAGDAAGTADVAAKQE